MFQSVHRHMYDQCYILKIGLWVLGSLAEQTQNSGPLLVKQGDMEMDAGVGWGTGDMGYGCCLHVLHLNMFTVCNL